MKEVYHKIPPEYNLDVTTHNTDMPNGIKITSPPLFAFTLLWLSTQSLALTHSPQPDVMVDASPWAPAALNHTHFLITYSPLPFRIKIIAQEYRYESNYPPVKKKKEEEM